MSDIPIAAIVAAADNDVIGRNNALPWDLPADLAHFRRRTMGKPILMGRRTFESIGRPLPGRSNIVITRNSAYAHEGVRVVSDFEDAVDLAEAIALIDGVEELVVIGGAEIYALSLPRLSRLYLTRVHAEPEGDAWLPPIDWDEWLETEREERGPEATYPGCTFLTYTRRRP
ncbi:MAG: dihydrofolate reductase [Halieaceae bacterium]|jgi:dihydrofolate reductase|nr:dihydrofolate reductase [Halieaceae bacterium]